MENIPCKYEDSWTENQSPLGSGLYWPEQMSDCLHPGYPDDEARQIAFEEHGVCDSKCPAYEPREVAICEKHGEFLKDSGCEGCMYDSYKECEEAGKAYFASK